MKKPDWLTLPAPAAETLDEMKRMLDSAHLHSVCESAACPNIGECFAGKTCTFMILGNICTRRCTFCAVRHGQPSAVDLREPQSVARAARKLGLKHVVVTSVTRDDLEDGGAGHFAATIRAVHRMLPSATIEVLIPDFLGKPDTLQLVIEARPDVINHNVETVPRLYSAVRRQACYSRSLAVLRSIHELEKEMLSKSGLMLGLGEERKEVLAVMEDLRAVHCDILTLGQYLSPSPAHYPVKEYISPEVFMELKEVGLQMGFMEVSAGPLVRSSYHAEGIFFGLDKSKKRKGVIGENGKNRQI